MCLGRKITEGVSFPPPHAQGTWRFITVVIHLDPLAESGLSGFSAVKSPSAPCPHHHTLQSLEGDHHVQPTPKEWGVTRQLLESEASTSSASIPQLLWALAASCLQLLPLSRKTAPGGPERAHHSPRASHGQWLADTGGQKPHPVTSIQRTTPWDTLYPRGPHGLCQDKRPLAHSSFFPSLFCYPYSLMV